MKAVLVLGAPFTRLKSRKVSSSDNSLKDLCTSMTVVMAQSLQKDYKLMYRLMQTTHVETSLCNLYPSLCTCRVMSCLVCWWLGVDLG